MLKDPDAKLKPETQYISMKLYVPAKLSPELKSYPQVSVCEWVNQMGYKRDRGLYHPLEIAIVLWDLKNHIWYKYHLEKLDMSGTKELFAGYWMHQFAPFLSSLLHLNISNCDMGNEEFKLICKHFTNLKYLNMCGTNVTSLAGVSKLKNLEVLLLADCPMASADGMKGLFHLSKLRVLDISGLDTVAGLRNAQHIWKLSSKSKKTMPALEFLDVGMNEICCGMMRDILFFHPSIKTVGLFRVPLEENALDNFDIEVLDGFTIANSVTSIEHYFPRFSIYKWRVVLLIQDNWLQLESFFDKQSHDDIHKLLGQLLEIRKMEHDLDLDHGVAAFLTILLKRDFTLSDNERQSIIECLVSMFDWDWTPENIMSESFQINIYIWLALDLLDIEDLAVATTIGVHAIDTLEKLVLLNQYFVTPMTMLGKTLKSLENNRLFEPGNALHDRLANNLPVYTKLVKFVAQNISIPVEKRAIETVVLYPIVTNNKEYRLLFTKTILDFIDRTYSWDSDLAFMLFDTFIGMKLEPYEIQEFTKPSRMEMYMKCMQHPSSASRSPIALLTVVFRNVVNHKFVANLDLSRIPTIQHFEVNMQWCDREYRANDPDRLGMFRRLAASEECADGVISFAQWVLEHYEDGAPKPGENRINVPDRWPRRQSRQ